MHILRMRGDDNECSILFMEARYSFTGSTMKMALKIRSLQLKWPSHFEPLFLATRTEDDISDSAD